MKPLRPSTSRPHAAARIGSPERFGCMYVTHHVLLLSRLESHSEGRVGSCRCCHAETMIRVPGVRYRYVAPTTATSGLMRGMPCTFAFAGDRRQ